MSAHIILIGNLGKDPETKSVGSDTVTKFSVAVNHKRKDQESTSWFNVDCWGKSGLACAEYLRKGSKVKVLGDLELREYEKDGVKRMSPDVRAIHVEFLDPKTSGSSEPDPFK